MEAVNRDLKLPSPLEHAIGVLKNDEGQAALNIHVSTARTLLDEINRLREQVTKLQTANTREVERRRKAETAHFSWPNPTDDPNLNSYMANACDSANLVLEELHRAIQKFPPFNSEHEGYAVLLEEVDELWAEVKKQPNVHRQINSEARQVAAMAIRMTVGFE